MNPAVIIGAIPAFWLSLILTLASTGICESKSTKSGECRFEWAITFSFLGLAGTIKAALGIFDAGYKTWNPDLHPPGVAIRKEEDRNELETEREETEPLPEPLPEFDAEIAAEPEVIPATEIPDTRRVSDAHEDLIAQGAIRNSIDRNDVSVEEEAKESLAARMEKAYEKKVQPKSKSRGV